MMTNDRAMSSYRCPRCGSHAIRDGRVRPAGGLHELACAQCGLREARRADARDLAAWRQTWAAPMSIAGVLAAPEADAPRLAYADAIAASDPERAELIRLQIARTAAERQRISHVDLATPRERTLLREHAERWATDVARFVHPVAQPRPDPGYAFTRGFVGFVRIAPDALTDQLFELAPVQHVDLIDAVPRAGFDAPELGRLRSLGLAGLALDDDDATALAAGARLAGLRWLDLRDNHITERGVRALAASAAIHAIPVVLLAGNPCNPARQYVFDIDGSAADSWRPTLADELEAQHGPIGWLELSPVSELPDRLLGL